MSFATADVAWFFQPVQAFATLAAAVNFGGSVLQSPLIMPTLQLPYVPVHYAAHQTAYLLHNSEYFFPPLNALTSLSNLILTVISFYYSSTSPIAAAKAPKLLLTTALNFATTAWALGIMVPMNKKMMGIAKELEAGVKVGKTAEKDEKMKGEAKELRRLQNRWRKMNYGRAAIMISSAVAGINALLVGV